ncbi:predicted protein [Aspergillus terreus NIH2624]|uniref:ADF-H domain-containing protein n=1 Tax=Aspergillus terreus (strain NIH 2624 / FGSC A1156) TaxID=341663 RepID=Q0CW90_ASPTN|nr:uncharacterized protein ATEG_02044 [Aspergillus terreus NIH2624]EAU37006.1 predicted protein [Aspergillus terreus NIH2624]
MSLNGLDNPAVLEAYQSVLTEAGGWFLLRYVSRDEVALLDRGTGGVPDVRNAIDAYEETSPLYGFLQYRRRKVVLSYMPEGLSRLIQASELTESALSSACLLHTASGSITSSSSSLRRRRLMEIAEDAEESPATKDVTQAPSVGNETRERSFSQLSEATIVPPPSEAQPPSNADEPSVPANPVDNHQPNGRPPSIAEGRVSEYAPSKPLPAEEASYAASEPRRSTQSARPSLRDLDRSSVHKQKVKLGPRPSVDGSGRPRTAGNLSRSAEQRPVVSLPAGMRSSSLRKSNPAPARPRSQGSTVASFSGMSSRSSTAPPVPPLLVPPASMQIGRPQLSPGARSLSALSSSGTSHEKERLMKALQLRKTQMQKKAQEGKNSKPAQEPEKPVLDAVEDKENIFQGSGTSDTSNKQTSGIENGKEPLSETQPCAPPEPSESPNEDEENSAEQSQSEPVLPLSTDPDQRGDPPADILPPTTNEENSMDPRETAETGQFQKTPSLTEPETNAIQQDLVVSVDREAKSGPDSPSAVIEVPLGEQSPKAPEEEITAASTSPPAETKPPVPAEPEGDRTGPSTDPLPPQSIALPTSPSSESPLDAAPDPSKAAASPGTTPQHELTPEIPTVEDKDVNQPKDKRKPLLEPIQVPTPEYSDDDNLLSDDSFMEELTSATVEEAKPISVGKSPLSPGYSNSANETVAPDAWRNSRAVSNPSAVGHPTPNMQAFAVGRSVSTPYPDTDNSTSPVLVAKKINVSSGISKRIKALEKFSNNSPSHSSQNLTPPSASSSFETLRKRASVSLSSPDNGPSRHSTYTPEAFSRASSVSRRGSQSSTGGKRTTRSVSVTARIIREPAPSDANGESTESGVLNLQASPLTVEHETSEAPLSQSLSAESATNNAERSMSTSSAASAGSGPPPRSESRLSISSTSRNEIASSPEEKKESRTSRLIRRMSSIKSHSRKSTVSTVSPVVKEESSPSRSKESEAAEAPEAVDIGEVNVQFPDALLWKRRFVRVDDQGYLVLTPANADSTQRNMVKRFHMTEFKTPCLPDEDREEMPNSIMLDLFNGSTLQCASLVHAHSIHQSPPTQ